MFGTLTNFESSLFDEVRRIEQEMADLFGRTTGIRSVARGSYPAVNIGATADAVHVYLFAPGIDPDSLDVTLQQNLLTVSGRREAAPVDGANYYRRERFAGKFQRVITLPDDIDPDRVEARYRNGILQIVVARREAVKPRQITIQ